MLYLSLLSLTVLHCRQCSAMADGRRCPTAFAHWWKEHKEQAGGGKGAAKKAILEQQNVGVERDLASLRAIRSACQGQLADERYDAWCRILVNPGCVKETQCERASGLLQDVCLAWLAMRRRQMNPAGPRAEPVGRQGPCPQRAARRVPGSNAQALPSEASRPVPMAGETTDVEPFALCAWLG